MRNNTLQTRRQMLIEQWLPIKSLCLNFQKQMAEYERFIILGKKLLIFSHVCNKKNPDCHKINKNTLIMLLPKGHLYEWMCANPINFLFS